jgi:formylmethanofuran dehydrogenase subunit B
LNALAESLNNISELLMKNSPALILGADALDESSIIASLELAEKVKGIWRPWGFEGIRRFYGCVKECGWATAVFDEVRDRADMVIFWRADPLNTHLRHLSRYSFFPRGRYTERGNSDRNLAAVSDHKTVIAPLCQQFFTIQPEEDVVFIKSLMNSQFESRYDHRDFPLLANAVQRASYIAVFVDPEKTNNETLMLLFKWSEAVNRTNRKRMVILPLFNSGSNIEGFARISLEHHKSCDGFDFSGKMSDAGGDGTLESISDIAESVIMIESGPDGAHRKILSGSFSKKPLVILSPFKQEPMDNAQVLIPVAIPGVETDGVFFRADGLPLLAEKIEGLEVENYPSAQYILKEIIKKLP